MILVPLRGTLPKCSENKDDHQGWKGIFIQRMVTVTPLIRPGEREYVRVIMRPTRVCPDQEALSRRWVGRRPVPNDPVSVVSDSRSYKWLRE